MPPLGRFFVLVVAGCWLLLPTPSWQFSVSLPTTLSNKQRSDVTIRPFEVEDAPAIAQLFHDTVRTVNIQNYTLSQVQVWAPDDLYFRDWATACQCIEDCRYTLVAEVVVEGSDNVVVAGFAELERVTEDEVRLGDLDCFFCHKDYQRQGVGRALR